MAYLGISPNIGNYTKLDDISSSFDGIKTTFSLTSGGKPFYTSNKFSDTNNKTIPEVLTFRATVGPLHPSLNTKVQTFSVKSSCRVL